LFLNDTTCVHITDEMLILGPIQILFWDDKALAARYKAPYHLIKQKNTMPLSTPLNKDGDVTYTATGMEMLEQCLHRITLQVNA
jgi:hypothetical protein